MGKLGRCRQRAGSQAPGAVWDCHGGLIIPGFFVFGTHLDFDLPDARASGEVAGGQQWSVILAPRPAPSGVQDSVTQRQAQRFGSLKNGLFQWIETASSSIPNKPSKILHSSKNLPQNFPSQHLETGDSGSGEAGIRPGHIGGALGSSSCSQG